MEIGTSDVERLYIGETELDKLYLGTDKVYEKSSGPDYRSMPLTFEITSDGIIYYSGQYSYNFKTIQYQLNNGEWTDIQPTTSPGTPINVYTGDIVRFKGNGVNGNNTNVFRQSTCGFILYGNIMSLEKSTGFETATTLTGDYNFINQFWGCTGLTDVSNLILPATTLADSCYHQMFMGCTSLVNAPELPATTLADYCYGSMFRGCTSLTTAPSLPATALAASCYNSMFYGCSSLVNAPALPATTLAASCYQYMFTDCTSLTTAPELSATTLVNSCYRQMLQSTRITYIKCLATDISASNCTRNWLSGLEYYPGTFVKNPNMTSWTTGANGIPDNWTVIDAS